MILLDEDFLPQAFALVISAKERIDISTFKAEINQKTRGLRLKQFFNLLYEKKSQGIQVNFLINWNDTRRSVPLANISAIKDLKAHNINVKILSGNRCCHAKILLVDRNRAIIGSHNLSVRSCHNNFEISYLIEDPASTARLAAIYDKILQEAQPPR
jgi:phosphatidylserine/phosphatidylglycerophosphate/cardiolipin synthase-like enzyme